MTKRHGAVREGRTMIQDEVAVELKVRDAPQMIGAAARRA
jgi:hypothetical protein